MGYTLPPSVSFCRIGPTVIFLDVAADRYFGLGADAEATFCRLLDRAVLCDADRSSLRHLVQRGILRDAESPTAIPRACAAPPLPTSSSSDEATSGGHRIQLAGALAQILRSELGLRLTSLNAVLTSLRAVKAGAAGRQSSREDLLYASRAFEHAALIVSPHNKCLPRAIAIARSLLARGVPTDLVLGVKVRPFRAHCWVQAQDLLIGDSVDNVRDFTPILIV